MRKWQGNGQNDVIQVLSKASIGALVIHSLVDGVFYHPFSLLTVSYIIALSANIKSGIIKRESKGNNWTFGLVALFVCVMTLHSFIIYVQREKKPEGYSCSLIQLFPTYINTTWWIGKDDSIDNRKKYIEIGKRFSSSPDFYDRLEKKYIID